MYRRSQGAEVVRLLPEPVRKRGQEPEQGAGSVRDGATAPEDLSRQSVGAQRAGAVGVGLGAGGRQAAAAARQGERVRAIAEVRSQIEEVKADDRSAGLTFGILRCAQDFGARLRRAQSPQLLQFDFLLLTFLYATSLFVPALSA